MTAPMKPANETPPSFYLGYGRIDEHGTKLDWEFSEVKTERFDTEYVPASAIAQAKADGRAEAFKEVRDAIQPYDNRESIVTWLEISIDLAQSAKQSPDAPGRE